MPKMPSAGFFRMARRSMMGTGAGSKVFPPSETETPEKMISAVCIPFPEPFIIALPRWA